MTPTDFVYWLQGWVEMEGGKKPNFEQWTTITDHLSLVFNKVTQNRITPATDGMLCEEAADESEHGKGLLEDLEPDPREMLLALEEAVREINNEDLRVMHDPLPPSFFDQKICSGGAIPDPRDLAFCHTAEEFGFRDRLPRKIRDE